MEKTVKVIQLGAEDFSGTMEVSECADWVYEPDFEELPKRDCEVAILDREITEEEYDYLRHFLRAYCLFVTETVPLKEKGLTYQLFRRKLGKRLTREQLSHLLKEELPDYFGGSYGEKFQAQNMSIAQGFKGEVSWQGVERIDLNGDYGNKFKQIVFWYYNIPLFGYQNIEFWLEYEKDDTVEIALEIRRIHLGYGLDPESMDATVFSEKELDDVVYIENMSDKKDFLFFSLRAKGKGRLSVIGLHDRHSRRGKGYFLPGGERVVTSKREEIFYYFDPGNYKPPLNVYFSGYKTQEGFEGYYMMRKMGHPFLLIAEPRLEGGAMYLGDEEYENTLEQILWNHVNKLGFRHSDVILSGLSMGTFGALYYGCKIRPNTILIGKPLANIGDVAEHTRLGSLGGSKSWVDVLHKEYKSENQDAIQKLNDRFWDMFDNTDWSETRFAVSYMIEDDMDGNAYPDLLSHLKDAGVRIYGKGLHGRHNDNTPGIVNWFVDQYHEIVENDFEKIQDETGRGT